MRYLLICFYLFCVEGMSAAWARCIVSVDIVIGVAALIAGTELLVWAELGLDFLAMLAGEVGGHLGGPPM